MKGYRTARKQIRDDINLEQEAGSGNGQKWIDIYQMKRLYCTYEKGHGDYIMKYKSNSCLSKDSKSNLLVTWSNPFIL